MKKVLSNLKGKYLFAVIALFLGLILLTLPQKNSEATEPSEKINTASYTNELELKITALLLEVEGIEKATVMVTLDNNGKQVLAENTSSSSNELVIINNGSSDSGILLTETTPVVRGVAIVCSDGNNAAIKEKITSLVSSALGIPTNRITVVG